MLKKNSRWLSIASGKVDFAKKSLIPLIFLITRGTIIEHVVHTWVNVDPKEVTETILNIITAQEWYNASVIQGIWTHGTTVAGFGILRLKWLQSIWNLPIVSITTEPPNTDLIKTLLLSKFTDGPERWRQFSENDVIPYNIRQYLPNCNIWISSYQISLKEACLYLKQQQINGCLPEGLRVAKLIASNINVLPAPS